MFVIFPNCDFEMTEFDDGWYCMPNPDCSAYLTRKQAAAQWKKCVTADVGRLIAWNEMCAGGAA